MNKTTLNLFKECNYTVCTDSRNITKDCLFFCLKGDNFDAHNFIDDIIFSGAKYIIVDNKAFSQKEKCIVVEDVLAELKQLATDYRQEFSIPIIAIGGSNGKTTTKELTKKVLDTKYHTHATQGNYNNHIGVPLTILNMPPATDIAIIEIGANHKGEHEELLRIVHPTHVYITNNGKDHLEGFGSVEGVKSANYEIYEYALKHNSKVFVADFEDDILQESLKISGENKMIFGYKHGFESLSDEFAGVVYKGIHIRSNLFGIFNEKNIITAVAIGVALDCDILKIKEAVENYQPELLRSQIKTVNNVKYYIDCYNANPSSMLAALKSFEKIQGYKVVILGDMLEMGEYADGEHESILEYVVRMHIDNGIFVGLNFKKFEHRYSDFKFFENVDDAKKYWFSENREKCNVLLKGSKGIKLRYILEL